MARALLGTVELSTVQSDNPVHDMEVTDKPVERGQDIADHIQPKPVILELSGTVIGDDATNKLEQLKAYQRDGELLTYINRVVYQNMVIERFEIVQDAGIENGFKFTMALKQVRLLLLRRLTF